MALTQDSTIIQQGPAVTGQTLAPILRIARGKVTLAVEAQPLNRQLAGETADVGTPEATTLLSYFDQSTGELTATGETWAKSLSYNGQTIDTYFS